MSEIVIYGKPNCVYCDKAKNYLNIRGVKYAYHSVGTDLTRDELLEMFPNARTVPIILINGKNIGGFDDMVQYFEETSCDYNHIND